MSRPDDRSEQRAWDDGTPTFGERLRLAVRQSPVRGLVVAALFLLSFAFLAGALIEFRDAIWSTVAGAGSALVRGDPMALLAVVVVLVAVGTATLLLRRA